MTTPDQAIAASDAEIFDQAAAALVRRYGLLTSGDIYAALRNRAEAIRRENGLPPVASLRVIPAVKSPATSGEVEEPGHGYWESGDM